jgi:AcrR family transcriptional regulator
MLKTFENLPKEKQRRIIDAIAGVIAEKGYYHATVADICKAANISNGALYKYFKSKEDVFRSIIQYQYRGTQLIFASENNSAFSPQKTIFKHLSELLEKIVESLERYPQYYCIYYDLGSPSMQRFAVSSAQKLEEPSFEFCLKLAKEGQKRGEIDPSIDTKVAALILDNHITLFIFSCISPYHDERFRNFFGKYDTAFTKDEKIKAILKSVRSVLKGRL